MKVRRIRISLALVQYERVEDFDILPQHWEAMSLEQREAWYGGRIEAMALQMIQSTTQDLGEVER